MEMKNIEMEATNMFQTKHYEISDTEKVPIIIQNWLGVEDLQFIQTLMGTEKKHASQWMDIFGH